MAFKKRESSQVSSAFAVTVGRVLAFIFVKAFVLLALLSLNCSRSEPDYTGGPGGVPVGTLPPQPVADSGPAVDAGVADAGSSGPLADGAPCVFNMDCLSNICATIFTPTDTLRRCSSCRASGEACGDAGFCVQQTSAMGVSFVCSNGESGQPCEMNAQCKSEACEDRVPPVGVVRFCK
jgi:hypothetical protein